MAETNNNEFKPVSADPKQASTAPVNPTTPEQATAAMKRQRELSDRIVASQTSHIKPGNPEIDSKLTTADHVGQHPTQPYKPDVDEARKVGDYSRIGAREGDRVETTPVAPAGAEEDAEPTDHVVLHPGEEPEDAAKRIQTAGKPPGGGELKPVEGDELVPSGHANSGHVANLPRSGASVLNSDGKPADKTEGGEGGSGANGEQ